MDRSELKLPSISFAQSQGRRPLDVLPYTERQGLKRYRELFFKRRQEKQEKEEAFLAESHKAVDVTTLTNRFYPTMQNIPEYKEYKKQFEKFPLKFSQLEDVKASVGADNKKYLGKHVPKKLVVSNPQGTSIL
jgi:hypothetical protein